MVKRVLITAGPTREYLDPVRFISNASSGEMGISLAAQLSRSGFRVDLVLGPVDKKVPSGIKVHRVISALDMSRVVKKLLPKSQVFIATAAVSDYRFKTRHKEKIKKEKYKGMNLSLVKNPDILKEAGDWKTHAKKKQPVLIGYALETKNMKAHGLKKLREKNCDLLIANGPASFGRSTIKALWLEKSGFQRKFPTLTKKQLAQRITQWLIKTLN